MDAAILKQDVLQYLICVWLSRSSTDMSSGDATGLGRADGPSCQTPEPATGRLKETAVFTVNTKTANLYLKSNYVLLLQKAPISQSYGPLKVL